MRQRVCATAFIIAGLLAAAPRAGAQDCSDMSTAHLRGTYTGGISGWMDPSKVLPGMGLPSGFVQYAAVSAFSLDGAGSGGGWMSVNMAGSQMNFEIAGLTYLMNSDCSVQLTWSITLKGTELTIGPFSRIGVIAGRAESLEITWIYLGAPMGEPGGGVCVDLGVARRISPRHRVP
jgi:hypothetical protein